MSRSGYSDDCDGAEIALYRRAVENAINGRRGQAFLKEMLKALDALPERKLVSNVLEEDGAVCAIGAVGLARGVDMTKIDATCSGTVSDVFGIAVSMAKEIAFENDEGAGYYSQETPEQRYRRMRAWVEGLVRK